MIWFLFKVQPHILENAQNLNRYSSLGWGLIVIIFCLETVDVLLRDLNVGLQLQDVDEELALVCELLLVVVDELDRTGIRQFRQHVEEHGVTVGLLHDLGHLSVKVIDQVSGRMVDNLVEALEANTTLADVTIE